MIISMSGVASGYLGSATVTNPGTGYRNGDTITIPAGNPVGSNGGSFVLGNYNAAYLGQVLANYTFGMDGNLVLPGNLALATSGNIIGVGNIIGATSNTTISAGSYTSSFLSNGVMTTANVVASGNVTASGTVYSNGNIAMVSNVARYTWVANTAPTSGQGSVGDIWYQTF
jgi:hypothetical protein